MWRHIDFYCRCVLLLGWRCYLVFKERHKAGHKERSRLDEKGVFSRGLKGSFSLSADGELAYGLIPDRFLLLDSYLMDVYQDSS